MKDFLNIRVFSESKNNDLNCVIDSKDGFYHYSLDDNIPENILNLNPYITTLKKEDLDSLKSKEEYINNFSEADFFKTFCEDMLDFSKNLFEKFQSNTIKDLDNIEEMIKNNGDHDIISKEFHRLKSTFATFGFNHSRALIEKKQKQVDPYKEKDIYEVKSSFHRDLIAINNFYKKREE